jgi:hypothetical protein
MTELELWVCVDANGDYGLGKDAESAKEQYENDVGMLCDGDGFRLYKLKLQVPLPTLVELSGTVADEQGGLVALSVEGQP